MGTPDTVTMTSATPLCPPCVRHRINVIMTDRLTQAVQRAIVAAPCSVAALALAAQVPQSTLARIQYGERNATPAVASAVATALAQWGTDYTKAAVRLRQQITRTERGKA